MPLSICLLRKLDIFTYGELDICPSAVDMFAMQTRLCTVHKNIFEIFMDKVLQKNVNYAIITLDTII